MNAALRRRTAALSLADLHEFDSVLRDWSLPDLRHALDGVDRRLAAIELIDRLARDPSTPESILHNLMLRSLWMFGPEYEQSAYTANATLRTVVNHLFGRASAKIVDQRHRPDIVVLPGASTYGFASLNPCPAQAFAAGTPGIVVIELKRGGSVLTRKDVSQVDGYAHDLAQSGALDGSAFINAWIVGKYVSANVPVDRSLWSGERCYARVRATSFDALVQTARSRLPPSLSALRSRYQCKSAEYLMERINT